MKNLFRACAICAIIAIPGICQSASFQKPESVVPVPPSEQGLQTIVANPLFTAGNNKQTLEGAIFDGKGNLFFCNVSDRKIQRLDPENRLETIFQHDSLGPSGLALHKDGRLFFTALNLDRGIGEILALSPDGNVETILAADAGYLPNDLVFDRDGGLYFTDFRGSATEPSGGVYYMAPELGKITSVIANMGQANGVALAPDGKTLWATEYARNLLHRAILADATKIPPTGSKIPYHFTGPAPDSMRVDADGNVYVAMVGQGRVMVFDHNGLPIGQILLPERDKGLNLRSTSVAVHPHKNEVRVVSGNTADASSSDAIIFTAPAFARGLTGAPDR